MKEKVDLKRNERVVVLGVSVRGSTVCGEERGAGMMTYIKLPFYYNIMSHYSSHCDHHALQVKIYYSRKAI